MRDVTAARRTGRLKRFIALPYQRLETETLTNRPIAE